jgi:predicted GNAT family acetyltransferase
MEEVVDNRDDGRFELAVGGHVGELFYRVNGDRLVLIHTEVPEELAGQGVGGRLVRASLDRAAREGLTIVPLCPFARRWMADHPDEVRGVGVDWKAAAR